MKISARSIGAYEIRSDYPQTTNYALFDSKEKASKGFRILFAKHYNPSLPRLNKAMNTWVVLFDKTPDFVENKRANNPRKKVLIYGQVDRILATKTQKHRCDPGCKKAGHRYYHDFGPGVVMYGLPDKSILIKHG